MPKDCYGAGMGIKGKFDKARAKVTGGSKPRSNEQNSNKGSLTDMAKRNKRIKKSRMDEADDY